MRSRGLISAQRRWVIGDAGVNKLFGGLGLVSQRVQGLAQAFDFSPPGMILGFLDSFGEVGFERAYQPWHNVGMLGYGIDGLREQNWRGRYDPANAVSQYLGWGSR